MSIKNFRVYNIHMPNTDKTPAANKHTLSLSASLALLWLLLSGHYTPLLLALGAVSVALTAVLALRLDVVDHESYSLYFSPVRLMTYWCWLLREIVVSNVYACRLILSPDLPISPEIITLRNRQKTIPGKVTFANSITLTPGTVTIDLTPDTVKVHAITREAAAALQRGEMDDKVAGMEHPTGAHSADQ